MHKSELPPDYKKHGITFLSFLGEERLSTQDNLFEIIQIFGRRLVVDTHIDWFDLSAVPTNANTAFILGTTADKETSPLRFIFENQSGNAKIRPNVFLFGMRSPPPEDILAGHRTPLLIISRLDTHATAIRDMVGLRKFEKPGGGKSKLDTSQSIAEEKTKILSLLETSAIEEAGLTENRSLKDRELRMCIERECERCFKDFLKSIEVARYAYARLLLTSQKTRSDFVKIDYPNVFGDTHLIQNALFFNAGILSGDKNVKKMARFCGIGVSRD
jgi:hypothetical protein